jgi:quercetin dioxygenase-like cupin family protein
VRLWKTEDVAAQSRGRGVTLRPLVPEPVPEELLTLMDFAPGASMRGTPHLPGTREFFTCLAGHVTLFVVGDRYDLRAGDVLGFPGNVAHSYQNPDEAQAASGISIVVLAKAGV